jgi:hypothetical protein
MLLSPTTWRIIGEVLGVFALARYGIRWLLGEYEIKWMGFGKKRKQS